MPRADWEGQILNSQYDSGKDYLPYGIFAEHKSRGDRSRGSLPRQSGISFYQWRKSYGRWRMECLNSKPCFIELSEFDWRKASWAAKARWSR
jgi:hypothetical protein